MRYLGVSAACVLAVTLAGCETFGFSAPANPLLPEAKTFRQHTPDASVARELSKELLPAYMIEPGDTLLVQPVEFDSPVRFPPDQPVLQDGTIDLGVYGRPVVAGKTLTQIEPEIQELVNKHEREKQAKKFKDPKDAPEPRSVAITVRLIGRVSKVYYVLGEVNVPNAYPLSGRETVLDAIVQAGGLTRRAAKDMIVLSRPTPPDGCRRLYPVCYDQIVQLGDTTTNYQLQPGDRVFIPSQGMLESLLPFLNKKRRSGPCCKAQVSCFAVNAGTVTGCTTADGAWAGPAATIPIARVVGDRPRPAPATALPAQLPTLPDALTLPNPPVAPKLPDAVPPTVVVVPSAPQVTPVAPTPMPTAPVAPAAPVLPAAPLPRLPDIPPLPEAPPTTTGSFGNVIRMNARLP